MAAPTDLPKALSWLAKLLTPTALLTIALAAAAFMLLPAPALDPIGLGRFRAENGPAVGAALLISVAGLIAQAIGGLAKAGRQYWKGIRYRKRLTKSLEDLAPEERSILHEYIVNDRVAIEQDITDGVVAGLESKGILRRQTSLSRSTEFDFNIMPEVRKILRRRPELIGLTSDDVPGAPIVKRKR